MSTPARLSAQASLLPPLAAIALQFVVLFLLTLPAHAVIVRGTVTNPMGVPVGNVRVQLVQGQQVAAFGYTTMDGTYEIRSSSAGRFILLASAMPFTPSIGQDFYGGRTDVVTRNIVMEYATITPQLAVTLSGIPTPVLQVPSAVTLIPQPVLATQTGIANDLRQSSGVEVVQTGQTGGPVDLYVRGGGPATNKILIDGISATDIGGRFDLSPVSTIDLIGPELYRGANSALYGTGAEASVLRLSTTHGSSLWPVLNYTGDAGNFSTYRNEATLSGTRKRLDYLAGFGRLNTSNALPLDEYHTTNSLADIGYSVLTNTHARFTLRNTDSDTGLPGPHDIYDLSSSGKQSNQDLYSGLTVENQWKGNWHNLARYGIARRREQVMQFAPTGEPVTTEVDGIASTTYYGAPVTLRGANGYTASGQAAFFTPSFDAVSNRNEFDYQTDYTFPYRIAALFSFQYENERARLLEADTNQQTQRTNFLYTLQVQGDIKHRFFYSLGGAIERNNLYGTAGTPRIGLSYAPVRPGHRIFRGTLIRANVATGVQEPRLEAELTSLETLLQQTGNESAIATYNVHPITAERSRTYDIAVDQNILNQKLILTAGYFHNQFNHQLESLAVNGLEHYFDIPATLAEQLPAASLNSLAYRTQGLETEIRYQPFMHLFLRGGYAYLASIVEQSFSFDATAATSGTPVTNPNIPGIAIGSLSPLVGSRPFRRAPSTGFFAVQYTVNRFSTAFKGALSSRSDDSTFQLDNDREGGNTLLLPNRNLDSGYAKLDLNMLFSVSSRFTVFTQLDNLLSQQHIGPIGYPGLPFTFRAGMKIRIGGD
ncbi:TonB-dependent receptor plug domain-containing protein [Granulicella sp. L60]|uniref:TonB-dependent receptor n=1 Tax=Granulicella sp. L60 TaxID=1641866 RepID=UPI00131DABAA|nr:TonB-dependent receptor plug domain-containing protein [Granulicella sp. L60]